MHHVDLIPELELHWSIEYLAGLTVILRCVPLYIVETSNFPNHKLGQWIGSLGIGSAFNLLQSNILT